MEETNAGGDHAGTRDALDFEIEVIDTEATEEELDRMTRNLLSELQETDVESADLVSIGTAPEGSKGDPITIGTLAMTVMPAVLPGVIDIIRAWAGRREGRTVKFKGKGIEFEGSAEELQSLLDTLETKHFFQETPSAEKENGAKRNADESATPGGQASAGNKAAHSPGVFISYRRADSADVTGRIYDRLSRHFGPAAIFKDVESIPIGIDFKEHLEKAVGECQIFLVVIGDKWLDATDAQQNYRLHDPRDFVRIEVETALQRNIPVIPLLVRGASMPTEEKLPPSLGKLAYRNGIPIRADPDFHRDMDRLIAAIPNYPNKKS